MHELSIAMNLVEIAQTVAITSGMMHVKSLHLQLGTLSGVSQEALLFAYEVATENTPLAGSQLEIEAIPVVIYCPQCQAEHELISIQLFQCPICGTACNEILQGKEIELTFMEGFDDSSHP